MFKKLASVMTITAIVCTLGGNSAFATNSSNPDVKTDTQSRYRRSTDCYWLDRLSIEQPSHEQQLVQGDRSQLG